MYPREETIKNTLTTAASRLVLNVANIRPKRPSSYYNGSPCKGAIPKWGTR